MAFVYGCCDVNATAIYMDIVFITEGIQINFQHTVLNVDALSAKTIEPKFKGSGKNVLQ